jgi:hypothetical protein
MWKRLNGSFIDPTGFQDGTDIVFGGSLFQCDKSVRITPDTAVAVVGGFS